MNSRRSADPSRQQCTETDAKANESGGEYESLIFVLFSNDNCVNAD